jgi:hypothetical protein
MEGIVLEMSTALTGVNRVIDASFILEYHNYLGTTKLSPRTMRTGIIADYAPENAMTILVIWLTAITLWRIDFLGD